MKIIALVLVAVGAAWFLRPPTGTLQIGRLAVDINGGAQPIQAVMMPVSGLRGAPSLTAAQIDSILAGYHSPAVGSGQAWVDEGLRYGIDPAYALAFFVHESSAGSNPNWAGIKGGGATTHNVGNIICAGYSTCYGRFRDYPDWQAGIEDWYRLITNEYITGRGATTVAQIVPIYAPASENDVDGYITAVEGLVQQWRGQSAVISPPMSMAGVCGHNVAVALAAQNGALRHVEIPPSGDWSFNETLGDPNLIPYNVVAGVPGGCWCDLAARYRNVARQLVGEDAITSVDHGLQLNGVPREDSIAIWTEGHRGGQDLIVRNSTQQTLVLEAIEQNNTVVITAVWR